MPGVFLDAIHSAEAALGRKRLIRWGPRTLDIDLLAYGRREIKTTVLTVPHIGIAYRHFVLIPWAEIAPEFWIPGVGRVQDLSLIHISNILAPSDRPGRGGLVATNGDRLVVSG